MEQMYKANKIINYIMLNGVCRTQILKIKQIYSTTIYVKWIF